jgi:hypothetical protein
MPDPLHEFAGTLVMRCGSPPPFAQGIWRTTEGGSVLLRVEAPTEAIIFSQAPAADHYEEAEYVIDTRRLKGVTVIRRYRQLSMVKS